MEILHNRHTVRNYDPNYEIPKEQLESILDAARVAPSYMNMQDIDFIVVNNRKTLQKITDAAESSWDEGIKGHILSMKEQFKVENVLTCDAPTVVFLVKNNNPSPKVDVDGGLVAMSICVAAADVGLSTMVMALPICEPVAKIIGTELEKMVICVAIGKARPDAHVTKRTRNNVIRYIE